MATLLQTLNHERGLVGQDYRCAGCSRPIGLIYGPAKLCGFTGGLYCPDCHVDEEAIVPARAFLNGDFSKRRVCRAVRSWMTQFDSEPMLDAILFNRHIYSFLPTFASLLTVRSQLHHLSAFLLSCRIPEAGEELTKALYGREHLYRQLHSYSMADLRLVQSGQLLQQLSKLVASGKQHVADCSLCSLKGFLCEACRSEAVIFPFDIESTYRCPACGSVYHSTCMDRFKPCPRCERWKAAAAADDVDDNEDDEELQVPPIVS